MTIDWTECRNFWTRRRAEPGSDAEPVGRKHTDGVKRAILVDEGSLHLRTDLVRPWPGRFVRIDGTRTYVRDTPTTAPRTAEPALYVHGLGGSSQNWTDVAGMLDHRLAGEAIDLPGFGRSDPADRYTVDAFAHRVIRCIEDSDRGAVHLIGNSLGGAIAVKVAAVRPDLIRTLTLISPALPFLDPRRSAQGRLLPLLAIPRADRLLQPRGRRGARRARAACRRHFAQACGLGLDHRRGDRSRPSLRSRLCRPDRRARSASYHREACRRRGCR